MRPNILFFLIDGLRADQCFGKDKTSYTPNIDSLIQKGTYFSNAFTSVDGTGLSLRAISHSLYPTKFESKTKLTLQKNNLFDILIKNDYEINGLVPDLKGFSEYANLFENKDKTSVTPNLDGLIQKGMYFTNAYSSVDGTILSLNTIFNGDFQIGNAARYQKVSLKQNNLIDVLKKNGYRVYGSLPNFASFNTLLQQFENKTDEENKGKNGDGDPVAAQFKQEKIEGSHSEYERNKATFPTGLMQKIIQILESTEKQEPYFCYFHIFDLHPLREGKMPIGIEDFGGEEYGNSTYA